MTGQPLSFDSAQDGYVHEKWAILTDAGGDRLYVSGSLNESQTALLLNAENIDVHADWWNDIESHRANDAQADFEKLWRNESPSVRVLTLPEAIREKLIRIGRLVRVPVEIDGSSANRSVVEEPAPFERLRFAMIRNAPHLPGGRYVGMDTAPIEPWPHQAIVSRRLVETWPYSYLLCDEVGLGKTIEAGLAIRSLVLSGLAKRVLIAPPASLTRQWHRELASKFFLPFGRALTGPSVRHEYIFSEQEVVSSRGLYAPDLCIISTGLLSRKERRKDLQSARPFDIALIDEAHCARRKNPTAKENCRVIPRFGYIYQVLQDQLRPKTACLWLATATPMQLDWIEVYDLLRLTLRVGFFLNDPSLTWLYYDCLGTLVRGGDIGKEEWGFLRSSIDVLSKQDPFLQNYLEGAVIDGRIRAPARHWLQNGRVPRGSDRKNIRRLIFAASPLSRVTLRHTRPLLEIYREKGKLGANLPTRRVLPIPRITFTPLERQAYDELEDYCKELTKQIEQHSRGQHSLTSLGFFLSFLRLRFASSLFAIRETLRRRREKVIASLDYQLQAEEPVFVDADVEAVDEEEDEAALAARGRSTFSELRRYAPVAAAMATLSPTFWAEWPGSV